MLCVLFSEAGVQNPNPRKRKKQEIKMGHGGTLDSAASGVLGEPRSQLLLLQHMFGQTDGFYHYKEDEYVTMESCVLIRDHVPHVVF